jgi:hypothetical protein
MLTSNSTTYRLSGTAKITDCPSSSGQDRNWCGTTHKGRVRLLSPYQMVLAWLPSGVTNPCFYQWAATLMALRDGPSSPRPYPTWHHALTYESRNLRIGLAFSGFQDAAQWSRMPEMNSCPMAWQ